MHYWILSRLDTRSLSQLATIRARAVRLRRHPKQHREPHFSTALAEFDAYVQHRCGR